MNTTITHIDITALYPHPQNPRIEPREDVVAQIAERVKDGFDPSHALIVRQIDSGYQIISGHHRALAAERAGLPEVPCWVREMTDDEAYMQLVRCNTQSELNALEEGKHAAESGMDLKAYAEQEGKKYGTLYDKVKAWRVYSLVAPVLDIQNRDAARKSWGCLTAIDAAPEWLWPAMVARMIEGEWTVATTRQTVGNFKTAESPPSWCNADAIAQSLLIGQLSIPDLARLYSYPEQAKITDQDLADAMLAQLEAAPGHDRTTIARTLRKYGYLYTSEGKLQERVTIGTDRPRMYSVKSTILSGDENSGSLSKEGGQGGQGGRDQQPRGFEPVHPADMQGGQGGQGKVDSASAATAVHPVHLSTEHGGQVPDRAVTGFVHPVHPVHPENRATGKNSDLQDDEVEF